MLKYISGDMFQVLKSPTSGPVILGHACNCRGAWGKGVALVFKKKFPSSYKIYRNHCLEYSANPAALLGTTLLIPVSPSDPGYDELTGDQTMIACFFTSVMGRDSPSDIVKYTGQAFDDMKKQLKNPAESIENEKVSEIASNSSIGDMRFIIPKINAGLFNVPWEDTAEKLEDFGYPITVYVL